MKVLLTGATGFLGWEVLKKLREQPGLGIRVLVRPSTLLNSEKGLELQRMGDVEIVQGDLSDYETLREAVGGADVVYHLAWKSGRGGGARSEQTQTGESPLARLNIDSTKVMLEACAEQAIRRFVYSSTVAVYGSSSDMSKWPVNEETPQEGSYGGDYSVNYIEPKREVERLIHEVSREAGFECVILRPSIIYGVGAPMAEQMARRALQGQRRQQQPGQQQVGLQMVHVRDAASAFVLAGAHPDAAGREFNIAGNDVASPEDMNQMLRAAAFRINRNLSLPGRMLGQFVGQQRYDTTKAEFVLGFRANIPLPDGLAEIMANVLGGEYTPYDFDQTTARVAREYDRRVGFDYLAGIYGHSDYQNFGYWAEGVSSLKEACDAQMEKLLVQIPSKKGTLLDVACGRGATTRYLLSDYPAENITAINISRKHLDVAKKNAPGVNFLLMDAAKLQFPDNSFDNIICVEAASHFNTRNDFFCEAYRVLKPGGRLVLSDAIFKPRSDDPRVRAQQDANYVRSAEEYAGALRSAGFVEVGMDDVTDRCWGGFSKHIRDYLERSARDGSLDTRAQQGVSLWFERVATYIETYVLGGGKKPDGLKAGL